MNHHATISTCWLLASLFVAAFGLGCNEPLTPGRSPGCSTPDCTVPGGGTTDGGDDDGGGDVVDDPLSCTRIDLELGHVADLLVAHDAQGETPALVVAASRVGSISVFADGQRSQHQGVAGMRALAIANLTGSSALDVVALADTQATLLSADANGFSFPTTWVHGAGLASGAIGAVIEASGYDQLVLGGSGLRVLRTSGNGFERAFTGSGPRGPLQLVADLDGDGALDAVQTSADGLLDVMIWWGDGAGSFIRDDLGDVAGTVVGVAAGDLDDDGQLDLLIGTDQAAVHLWLGDGEGGFSELRVLQTSEATSANGFAVADLDGDGWLDPALSVAADDRVIVWRGGAGPSWSSAQAIDVCQAPGQLVTIDGEVRQQLLMTCSDQTQLVQLGCDG